MNSSSEPETFVVSAVDGLHGPDRLDGQNAEDMEDSGREHNKLHGSHS